MPSRPKLSFVDLFAGCGGLSLGLENAGWTPLLVNELSPDALGTYLHNRAEKYPHLSERYHFRDIKDLLKNNARLLKSASRGFRKDFNISTASGDIDLVVGGPPCQGFSGIGHRRSYGVDRKQLPSNHLFRDMIEIIQRLRPKLFLFENVRGLLSARWTSNPSAPKVWDQVWQEFSSIDGYDTAWTLARAGHYGVPQNRPRVFIVGVRSEIGKRQLQFDFGNNRKIDDAVECGLFPEGQPGSAPDLIDLLGDLVDPAYFEGAPSTLRYPHPAETPVQRELRLDPDSKSIRRKRGRVTQHEYTKHSEKVRNKFEFLLDPDGEIPEKYRTKKFAQRVLPKHWDDRGPTITATSLPDDYVHFAQPRILTVREWARLQTFPDWYDFKGNRTTGGIRRAGNPRQLVHDREVPRYTQIGNAVPVKLAEKVGLHFREILGK